MSLQDRVARRCISFARDHFRNSWLHRLPVTGRVYDRICSHLDTPDEVDFRGVMLRIDRSDTTITPTLLTGQYEAAELDLLESILEADMVVVDVGANNGTYTCISSQRVGAHGRVIAIEPIAANLSLIEQSIALNKPTTNNVTVVPTAAGAASGTLRIHLDDGNSGTHSVGGTGERWEDVPVRAVSEIVDELRLESLDVIKIDVEGFEPQVFAGARAAIERFSPTLLCEFDSNMIVRAGGSPTDFAAQLFAYGTVLKIDEHKHSLVPLSQAACAELGNSNVVVVPESRQRALRQQFDWGNALDPARA